MEILERNVFKILIGVFLVVDVVVIVAVKQNNLHMIDNNRFDVIQNDQIKINKKVNLNFFLAFNLYSISFN